METMKQKQSKAVNSVDDDAEKLPMILMEHSRCLWDNKWMGKRRLVD